jgi:membrane fusion protein (multidrug efflux system)
LLVVLPAIAVIVGLWFYLSGGRYVTTDNAYVGAQKVLITPEVSGKITGFEVSEGQHVKKGDILFTIGQSAYIAAADETSAQVEQARSDYMDLKATLASLADEEKFAEDVIEARQAQFDNNKTLVARGVTAQNAMHDWGVTVATAKTELAKLKQTERESLAKLLGDSNLPLEKFPAYMQAVAAHAKAIRDLDSTTARAPIDGVATEVANIQVGRYLTAGTPVFAIVASDQPWVDANPKETDLTHVRPGQQVTITVDTFPSKQWRGTVESISPGTGAQFSILPPENAAGNWIKVVQRVPVRIVFDVGQDTSELRAGLSAYVSIDTHRTRSLASLIGLQSDAEAATPDQKAPAARKND